MTDLSQASNAEQGLPGYQAKLNCGWNFVEMRCEQRGEGGSKTRIAEGKVETAADLR